jgi:hypothetical protein
MVMLDTTFSEEERRILLEFVVKFGKEVKVLYAVDENNVFYEGLVGEERQNFHFDAINRMIEVGGLYLLEEKNCLGVWNMGDWSLKKGYVFWGEYGTLDVAIKDL